VGGGCSHLHTTYHLPPTTYHHPPTRESGDVAKTLAALGQPPRSRLRLRLLEACRTLILLFSPVNQSIPVKSCRALALQHPHPRNSHLGTVTGFSTYYTLPTILPSPLRPSRCQQLTRGGSTLNNGWNPNPQLVSTCCDSSNSSNRPLCLAYDSALACFRIPIHGHPHSHLTFSLSASLASRHRMLLLKTLVRTIFDRTTDNHTEDSPDLHSTVLEISTYFWSF
jgi:hypothetical protein